jgi:hypothetical protein
MLIPKKRDFCGGDPASETPSSRRFSHRIDFAHGKPVELDVSRRLTTHKRRRFYRQIIAKIDVVQV